MMHVIKKCSPYHVGDKAVIMGDAGHAMVPFYGQGMNAGLEDCLLFDELLVHTKLKFWMVIAQVRPEYNHIRNVDAKAICDLAMYNYVEVSFIRTRYHEAIEKRRWQDQVLSGCAQVSVLMAVVGGAFLLRHILRNSTFSDTVSRTFSKLQIPPAMATFQNHE